MSRNYQTYISDNGRHAIIVALGINHSGGECPCKLAMGSVDQQLTGLHLLKSQLNFGVMGAAVK